MRNILWRKSNHPAYNRVGIAAYRRGSAGPVMVWGTGLALGASSAAWRALGMSLTLIAISPVAA